MLTFELALPPGQAARLLRHLDDTATRARGKMVQLSWLNGDAPAATFRGRDTPFSLPGTEMKLTLLRGQLRAGDRAVPLCRLSLSGAEADVRDQALGLVEGFAVSAHHVSLADEAAALAANEPAWGGSSGTVALSPNLSVGDGFAQIVAHLGPAMLTCAAAIGHGGEDPEPVHQMRVALRRLRSAFSIFRPLISCLATTPVADGLRELARALGPARDWDVFLGEAGAQVGAAFPDNAAVAALLRAAAQRRDAAYKTLAELRASAEFRRLAIHLALLAHGTLWHEKLTPEQHAGLDVPLADFAAEVLSRRHRRVLRAGKGLGHLDMAGLHRLRLRGKRLRYAAEFFADLHAPEQAERFISRLSRLQERLGTVNDTAVASELMAQLGPPRGGRAFATGAVLGFVAAEATRARGRIKRPWRRFRRLDPFWV